MSTPIIKSIIANSEAELLPSKTYKLDVTTKRIIGNVDGIEAIRQHIYKVLSTERVSYAIYGTPNGCNFGVELDRFIGQNVSFIMADIERTIGDALLQDERILGIKDFVIGELKKDCLEIRFTVSTILGDVDINEEARIK